MWILLKDLMKDFTKYLQANDFSKFSILSILVNKLHRINNNITSNHLFSWNTLFSIQTINYVFNSLYPIHSHNPNNNFYSTTNFHSPYNPLLLLPSPSFQSQNIHPSLSPSRDIHLSPNLKLPVFSISPISHLSIEIHSAQTLLVMFGRSFSGIRSVGV